MFNHSDTPLEAIHRRFQTELKDHLRKDMCAIMPNDTKDAAGQKMRLDEMLRDLPLEDALSRGFQERLDQLAALPCFDGRFRDGRLGDPTHPAGFQVRLQGAEGREKRTALYIAYYCTPGPEDPSQLRNLKTKYAKQFESGMSHDTVLSMWKAEADEAKARDLMEWQQRLAELQMAQSAHLKAKQKKMSKVDAKIKNSKHIVECSLPGCDRQIDKSVERVVECAVCDWLAQRNKHRRRTFYCSQHHNEEDFVSTQKLP